MTTNELTSVLVGICSTSDVSYSFQSGLQFGFLILVACFVFTMIHHLGGGGDSETP